MPNYAAQYYAQKDGYVGRIYKETDATNFETNKKMWKSIARFYIDSLEELAHFHNLCNELGTQLKKIEEPTLVMGLGLVEDARA